MPWSLRSLVARGRHRFARARPARAAAEAPPPPSEQGERHDGAARLADIDDGLETLSRRVGALETTNETTPLLIDAIANMNSASRRLAERGDHLDARIGDIEDQLQALHSRLHEVECELADAWLGVDEIRAKLQMEATRHVPRTGRVRPSGARDTR